MKLSKYFVVLGCLLSFLVIATSVRAADYPAPAEGDWVVRDFRFHIHLPHS